MTAPRERTGTAGIYCTERYGTMTNPSEDPEDTYLALSQ
jgi:hypothetical protein